MDRRGVGSRRTVRVLRFRAMCTGAGSTSILTFGDFQLDCRSRELRKRGRRLPLQPQPFEVLSLLVAASGDVVTREELRGAVWGRDTHVDFDRDAEQDALRLRLAGLG
jgi:DNA-binding response OmpR family regulator